MKIVATKDCTIPAPDYAQIGQTIVVSEVDENGKPTKWEVVDASWNDLKDKPFYAEIVEKTVECTSGLDGHFLDGFPVFTVGDTVTVKVDGVEYSLVAFDDDGLTIGDSWADLENGTGQLGWQIYEGGFFSAEEHTVSYMTEIVHKLDVKYLPEGSIEVLPITGSGREEDVRNVKIKLWDPNQTYRFGIYDGELVVEENSKRRKAFFAIIRGNTVPTHTNGTRTLINTTMTLDYATEWCVRNVKGVLMVELGNINVQLQSGQVDYNGAKKFVGFGTGYNPDNGVFYRCILTLESEEGLVEGNTCSVKCDVTAIE